MDNFDYLSVVFDDYCIKHGLPLDVSADDMLYGDFQGIKELTESNKQWLRKFIQLWEELV